MYFLLIELTNKLIFKEMRIASAVKWYELGEVSQAKAAEIAGLNRSEFIQALARYRVDFMQYTAEELEMEMNNVDLSV